MPGFTANSRRKHSLPNVGRPASSAFPRLVPASPHPQRGGDESSPPRRRRRPPGSA